MVQLIIKIIISTFNHTCQVMYLLSSFPITDWELVVHRIHPTQSIFQWIVLVVIYYTLHYVPLLGWCLRRTLSASLPNTNFLTVQILTTSAGGETRLVWRTRLL